MFGQAATVMNQPHTPFGGSPGRVVDDHAGEAERQWGLFTHLVGLLGLGDFTFLGLIGAIIMWKVKEKESPFLDDHGRESVNFQITMLIYAAIGVAIAFVSLGILAIPVILALVALRIIGCVRGALAAHRGEYYRYPMTFRFL